MLTTRVVAVDSQPVAESLDKCKSSNKTETDDPGGRKVLVSDKSMTEVAQREQKPLPGVISLISNHLQLAALAGLSSLSSDVYKPELKEEPEVKIADTNQARIDESIQHFHTPDVKYLASNADTEKVGYMHEEHEDTKKYKDSLNYSMHKQVVTPPNNNASEFIPSETTSLTVGAPDGRAFSEDKLQLPFDDHRSFVNHSRMCYSENLNAPLSPATTPGEKHLQACGNILDTSPINYSYQNYLSSWEQENNRYFNLAWRNDIYAEKAIACVTSGDVGSAKTLVKNNGIVNNINIDNCCFSKTFVTDASCGSVASSGRRRRRRVQTPVQRTAANMRERRRMCHLNVAFDRLKERLPSIKNKQKLSRIQTLKAAIDYINLLRDSLSLR